MDRKRQWTVNVRVQVPWGVNQITAETRTNEVVATSNIKDAIFHNTRGGLDLVGNATTATDEGLSGRVCGGGRGAVADYSVGRCIATVEVAKGHTGVKNVVQWYFYGGKTPNVIAVIRHQSTSIELWN